MLFPMSKSAPDAEAGGPLVQAMRGGNSLANDMLLKKINEAKAYYAPQTEFANAASKLAYSNYLAPQFMAKMLKDPAIAGSMTPQQFDNIMSMINGAASNNNKLGQLPQAQAPTANNKSFGGWALNTLKNLFQPQQFPAPLQMQQNPVAQTMPSPASSQGPASSSGAGVPQDETVTTPTAPIVKGKDYDTTDPQAKYEAWLDSPEGKTELAKGDEANIPDNQGIEDWWNMKMAKQPVAAPSTPSPVPVSTSANPSTPSVTQSVADPNAGLSVAERAAKYLSVINEGKTLGTERGKTISQIGQDQLVSSNISANLDSLINDVNNPKLMELRSDFPFFQDVQLNALTKIGSPEQQEMIAKFKTRLKSFAGITVNSFRGQTLRREFDYANELKPNESDTINTVRGKLTALKALKEIAVRKNDVILDLMQNKHMNTGDAVKIANKIVDTKAINEEVEKLTAPMITLKNPKQPRMKITLPLWEARQRGVKNV